MKLKARHARSWYKNDEAWLKAVYRKNKDSIDSVFGDLSFTTPFRAFKARVNEMTYDKHLKEVHGGSVTLQQAVTGLGRTIRTDNKGGFMSKSEILKENAISAIRNEKEYFKVFRKMTGWKEKVDPSKLEWDSDSGVYIYHGAKGDVAIDFSNSPKQVRIYAA